MATIAQNLQKIINSKAAIKQAIADKGGTITDSTPLDEYAQAIYTIATGNPVVVLASQEEIDAAYTIWPINDTFTAESYVKTYDFKNAVAIGRECLAFKRGDPNQQTRLLEEVLFPKASEGATPFDAIFGNYRFSYCPKLKRISGSVKTDTICEGFLKQASSLEEFLDSNLFTYSSNLSVGEHAFSGAGYNVFRQDETKRGQLGEFTCGYVDTGSFAGANFSKLTVLNNYRIENGSVAILGREVVIKSTSTSIFSPYALNFGIHVYSLGSLTQTEYVSGCHVQTLRLKATTPPTVSGAFPQDTVDSLQHIYVPSASVNSYKTATNWSQFASIIEADPDE